jgi:signal transduction histidine kinase
LLPTLRSYLKSFTQRTGIQVSLTVSGLEQHVDPEVETMLFRVTQEGLNNILKHSGAQNVSVKLSDSSSETLLEICDDGKGFVLDSSSELKGSGIQGMRDRVTLLGGKFTIDSNLKQGTTLRIQLPSHKNETNREVDRG